MSTLESHWIIAEENYGPAINVTTWFLLVISVLAVTARLSTKLAVFRKIYVDDWVMSVAVIFCIAQSITLSVQATNGFGQHLLKLTAVEKSLVQQSKYAADILYIAVLGLAKVSILLFIRTVTPVPVHRKVIVSLGAFISLWTATSIFVIAFQCQLPYAWEVVGNSCSDQPVFWNYFGIINMLTDLALVILPCHVVCKIQLQVNRKILVASCFACRILVFTASICELYYYNRASGTSDLTFDTWPVALCRQFLQNASIITACVPYSKSFLETIKAGIDINESTPPKEQNSTYWYLSDKFSTPCSGRSIAPLSSQSSWKTADEFWEYAYGVEDIKSPRRSSLGENKHIKVTEDKGTKSYWSYKSRANRPFKQSRVWTLDPETQSCERWRTH